MISSSDYPYNFKIADEAIFLKHAFDCDLESLKGDVKSIKTISYLKNYLQDSACSFLLSSYLKTFDRAGNIVTGLGLDEKDNIIWRYEYKVDIDNLELSCNCYNADNELEEILYNKIDVLNQVLRRASFDVNGTLLWEIKYHYVQNILSLIEIEPGNFFDYCGQSLFNEYRDEIERIEQLPSGIIQVKKFEYQYDNRGNWITRIERQNRQNQITAITKRTIHYYENTQSTDRNER